jgi:hypothetical protein
MSRKPWLGAVALLCARLALAAEPNPPDWSSVANESTLVVLSENPDGSPHETTVWLAVVDGQIFIRTGNTAWYPNLERHPDISVRIAGVEHPVRAEVVNDEGLRAKVIAAFNAKYGWEDTFVGWIFRGKPHIVRLAPRGP